MLPPDGPVEGDYFLVDGGSTDNCRVYGLSVDYCFLYVIFQCFEHQKQNPIHLYSIKIKREIIWVDILKSSTGKTICIATHHWG